MIALGMNKRQTLVVMRMLGDPRLPLELGDIFCDSILTARPGTPVQINEERLEILSQYLPDLVSEYRKASEAV